MRPLKQIKCVVIMVYLLLNTVQCQFSPTPRTVITFMSRQLVQFTCGIDSGNLIWEVNGTEARFLRHRNISLLTQNLYSTLSIEASLANNNSEVVCIKSTPSFEVSSMPAYLYIQGLLKQPTNLTVVTRTHLSVHLKWTPPFTLNVSTQQEPAIQHYVIFLTKTINGREEREEIMTANSSYTYNRQHFSHCLKINFQVAAVNQVGRGNLSVNLDTSFLEPTIKVNPDNITVQNGDWAHFSCTILCSSGEIVVWFVNGAIFPPPQSPKSTVESSGFISRRSPRDSYCGSGIDTYTESVHNLSLLADNRIGLSSRLSVYCAVVSICNKSSNCTTSTCFSNDAYLLVDNETKSLMSSPAIYSEEVTSLPIQWQASGASSDDTLKRLLNGLSISFGLAFVGALLLLIIIITTLIACRLYNRKGIKENENAPPKAEIIYDEVQTPSTPSPAAPMALNRCPAYEMFPCK